ncbi:C2 calcium-dependent membrane targeting [Cynara cardunculus var. scolymus]|uniref:Phospholipase D alpha 1 n=1 Tax=Cynara cardunculus var. scolymus TaxID=59895 RepID=A0A103XI41_CYNCS|nr:C2 calcium-dependent membrane targeting [Cynara cardunculus var. scolymus]
MENNYNQSSQYNPYPYGYHPNSAPYPPPSNYPQYPPPNSAPYPPYPQPYPYQSPPPPPAPPGGPPPQPHPVQSEYWYPPPQPYPALPLPYPYPTYGYPPPPPSHYHQESGGGGGDGGGVSGSNPAAIQRPSLYPGEEDISSSSSNPYYPPIDHHLAHLSLSENVPSAPASPPAPAAAETAPPAVTPIYQSVSAKYESESSFYTHRPSDSFSSFEGSYSHSGPLELSQSPTFGHTPSFIDPENSEKFQMVPFGTKKALKVLLLHGNLDIWIHDARNLPNMDMFHKTMGDVFNRLPGSKVKITSDPYVSIGITNAVIGRTYVISNSENPIWKQHFNVPVAHHAAEIHFLVKDSDVVGSQLIGVVAIPVENIYSGSRIEGFFPLINTNGRPCKSGAGLRLTMQYTSMANLSLYHNGIGAGPQYFGVPGTYFPLRRGGRVTLYQDAHVHHGSLPDFKLEQGMHYVHGTCWMDIFDAISKARHLIYITGWSVWHKVKLVRQVPGTPEFTLGDLLKLKSQEGVRAKLKLNNFQDGLMATHDEETRHFFKNSSVQVLLVPRMAGKRHSWIKKQEVGTIYTHHQKTVIVDADAGYGRKRIVAFVGGLDLCDGRYDSPQHPLFRTLSTVHADDFHNPTFTGNLVGCPREPWHDMHSKIDGPAAYDVMTNFEERWLKASKPHGLKKLKTTYDDALLRIERVPEILGVNDQPCLSDQDPEGWHVQIFRSIDSNSVKGFPKDPREATTKNLVCGKNVMIDMSIHSAYVKAIRSAQHFIYIENQYFIGSSYNWSSYKDLGANNLIPMEIALKIASKIKAHERFAVYVVIPMWPEGVPTGSATQRILFWQNKTMQMMYETIHKALIEVGLEDAFAPQDFLNFFCLGNRESAGMIVDDEYVIIGSANINQRSLEGTRDTEIAMGAYQPHHTWAKKLSSPKGQVYGYRMSLWAEHIGLVDDLFTQPETIECVRRVRSLSEANWKQFAADEVSDMRGHLLKYPVEVDRRGKVRSLPGVENFPDVGGQIIGSFLGIQENLTI